MRAARAACACVLAAALIGGCGTLERALHAHGAPAPAANTFALADGATLFYYIHQTGPAPGSAAPGVAAPGTALFIFGGSGCPSWKAQMPNYVAGFSHAATVYAVNKRHAPDDPLGELSCSRAFYEHDHIAQWVSDYRLFIDAMLGQLPPASSARPRQVMLIGASEGALPAMQLAATHPAVTHLALIGFGGWSIRRSMQYWYDQRRGVGTNPADVQKAIENPPGNPRDEINLHRYRWWRGVFEFDPMPLLKTLTIPVIVGMGEDDVNLPSESARDLQHQFSAAGKRNAYVHIYAGANHGLNAAGRSYHDDFFGELARCAGGNCTNTMP